MFMTQSSFTVTHVTLCSQLYPVRYLVQLTSLRVVTGEVCIQ